MSRIARVVVTGYPHHVTQRGNNREVVFCDDTDRRRYLEWLKEYSKKFDLKIWSYCLMSNHVHFVAVPGDKDSLAKTFKHLHNRYALYFNKRRNRMGHLWQGRFFSSILEGDYLTAAVRYVERNPVRAGLVNHAQDYPWSSAKAHALKESDDALSPCPLLDEIQHWSNFLASDDDPVFTKSLREATFSGRPVGNSDFIDRMEKVLGRALKSKPMGRPWPKKLASVTN